MPITLLTPCGQREKEGLIIFCYEQRGGGEREQGGREWGVKSLKPRLSAHVTYITCQEQVYTCLHLALTAPTACVFLSVCTCECAFTMINSTVSLQINMFSLQLSC